MRLVRRPTCPPEFAATIPAIAKERAAAVKYFVQHEGEKAPDLKAYKLAGRFLDILFEGKCAYCESRVLGDSPTHVEHFRPKLAVDCADGTRITGYWWLASEWANLVAACFDCNSRHKRNFFPLEVESARAAGPGGERGEEPLLLDPCGPDDPAWHLEFGDSGVVIGLTHKGSASIRFFGLSRLELETNRASHLLQVDYTLTHVKKAIERFDRCPGDPGAVGELEAELNELKRLLGPEQPFQTMTTQRVIARLPPDVCAALGL